MWDIHLAREWEMGINSALHFFQFLPYPPLSLTLYLALAHLFMQARTHAHISALHACSLSLTHTLTDEWSQLDTISNHHPIHHLSVRLWLITVAWFAPTHTRTSHTHALAHSLSHSLLTFLEMVSLTEAASGEEPHSNPILHLMPGSWWMYER